MSNLWRFAHHDYNIYYSAPNIELMFNNAMFQNIYSDEPVYLAHITTALDKIKDNGLFPSPGCLVGSVYCVPVSLISKNNFRLHNLGAFYYLEEFPGSIINDTLDILIIKINKQKGNYSPQLSGINYLRMGDIHYNTFEKIKHVPNMNEVGKEAVRRLNESQEFIKKAVQKYIVGETEKPENFLEHCSLVSKELPIISYFYFEAIYGFIMLHANDEYSQKLKSMGEMNNYYAKSFLFDLFPRLKAGTFRLSDIRPEVSVLKNKLMMLDCLSEKSKSSALEIIAVSIIKNITNSLFNSTKKLTVNDLVFSNDIDHLSKTMRPLLGHLIHRILRHNVHYEELYGRFEEEKAKAYGDIGKKSKIYFPFNSLYPKGEIGFTPVTSRALNCEYYTACDIIQNNNEVHFKLGKKMPKINVHYDLINSNIFSRRDGSKVK